MKHQRILTMWVTLCTFALALLCVWSSTAPAVIDGSGQVGNCDKCNWDSSKQCKTSKESLNNCQAEMCYTGGVGSGEISSSTYCSGEVNCDEGTGGTCSIGHTCEI